jgi:transposase
LERTFKSASLNRVALRSGIQARLIEFLPWNWRLELARQKRHSRGLRRRVTKGAHAVLLLDRAGWHTIGKLDLPDNITPIFLPSRAPELNPVENVWQYLGQNWLSNTVFENYDAIVDECRNTRSAVAHLCRGILTEMPLSNGVVGALGQDDSEAVEETGLSLFFCSQRTPQFLDAAF